MAKLFSISLIQCQIHPVQEEMDKKIDFMIHKVKSLSSDLVILPERWRTVPPQENFFDAIEPERGHSYQLLKELAQETGIWIVSGGIWEKRQNGRNYITCYVFDENGEEIGRQDKIHLYSYEPKVFTPGDSLQIFTHSPTRTKFSILICFDIAFFETPRLAVEHGAEILLSPTLIRTEGMYNWKVYLQARALENRVPIVACNPVGTIFGNTYQGNSKIISFKRGHSSPSILKITEGLKSKQEILSETINLSFPNTIRKKRLSEKREKESISVIEA